MENQKIQKPKKAKKPSKLMKIIILVVIALLALIAIGLFSIYYPMNMQIKALYEKNSHLIEQAEAAVIKEYPDSNMQGGYVASTKTGGATLVFQYTSNLPVRVQSLDKEAFESSLIYKEIDKIARIVAGQGIAGYDNLKIVAKSRLPGEANRTFHITLKYKDVVDIAKNPERPLYKND